MQVLGFFRWESFTGQSHFRLSRSCIRCINLEDVDYEGLSFEVGFQSFLIYSGWYWIKHAQEVEMTSIPQTDLLHRFSWPSDESINRWANQQDHRGLLSQRKPTIPHVAICYDLLSALDAVGTGHCLDCQNEEGQTLLHTAVISLNLPAVSLLVARGASVDHLDRYGRTPLMYAATNGWMDAASLLLEHAANLEHIDEAGRTPLSHAASDAEVSTVEWLVEKGARVDIPDHRGQTPLSYAAGMDKEDTVKLMLGNGASPNTPDFEGQTPLHWAAKNSNSTALLRALLDGGASINAQDNEKNTALTCAIYRLAKQHLRPNRFGFLNRMKSYVHSVESVIFLLEKTAEISEKDLRALDEIWSIEEGTRKGSIFNDLEARYIPLETLKDLHERISGTLTAKGLTPGSGYKDFSTLPESLPEQ